MLTGWYTFEKQDHPGLRQFSWFHEKSNIAKVYYL